MPSTVPTRAELSVDLLREIRERELTAWRLVAISGVSYRVCNGFINNGRIPTLVNLKKLRRAVNRLKMDEL